MLVSVRYITVAVIHLAYDWNDSNGAVGPLSRKSFQLHADLNHELNQEIDYRKLNTLSVRARKSLKGRTNISRQSVQNITSKCPEWLNGDAVMVLGVDDIGNQETTAQVSNNQ